MISWRTGGSDGSERRSVPSAPIAPSRSWGHDPTGTAHETSPESRMASANGSNTAGSCGGGR